MAMRGNQLISPALLSETVRKMLEDCQGDMSDGAVKAVEKSMNQMLDETKSAKNNHMGKRKGKYFNYMRQKELENSKMGNGICYSRIWYVAKPEYRLSHLLNNGHGGKAPYGGDPFITDAYNNALDTYEAEMDKVIRNACE